MFNRNQGSNINRTNYMPYLQDILNEQNRRPALIKAIKGTRCQHGVRLVNYSKPIPAPVKTERFDDQNCFVNRGQLQMRQETIHRTCVNAFPNAKIEHKAQRNSPLEELLFDRPENRAPIFDDQGQPLIINGRQYFAPAPSAKKPRKSIFEETKAEIEDDEIVFECEVRRHCNFQSIKREYQEEKERVHKEIDDTTARNDLRINSKLEGDQFGTEETVGAQWIPPQVNPTFTNIMGQLHQLVAHLPALIGNQFDVRGNQIGNSGLGAINQQSNRALALNAQHNQNMSRKRAFRQSENYVNMYDVPSTSKTLVPGELKPQKMQPFADRNMPTFNYF